MELMIAGVFLFIFGLAFGVWLGWLAGTRGVRHNPRPSQKRSSQIPVMVEDEPIEYPNPPIPYSPQNNADYQVQSIKPGESGRPPLMDYQSDPDASGEYHGWKYVPQSDITPEESAVLMPALVLLNKQPGLDLEAIDGWDMIKRHFEVFKVIPPTKEKSPIVPYLPLKGNS